MKNLQKKIMTLILPTAMTLGTFSAAFAAEDISYIPLRKTFENMGANVSWYDSTPDKAFVTMENYPIVFRDGSAAVAVDEGEFTLSANAYMKDGVTYIPEDSVNLCKSLLLYHNAIIDASVAEENELMPLRAIDTNEESVLVCTWNKYPETYVTGKDITINYGDVWVFTEDEVHNWGQQNGMAENMTLRMEQLIGLPPQKGYTHFSVLRVNPADLYRPSRDNEINDTVSQLTFPENATEEYKQWFNSNAEYSYNPHRYPWTGLGYTYDWADNGTEYGMSEFILKDGAKAKVKKTYTNEEFFEYITKK